MALEPKRKFSRTRAAAFALALAIVPAGRADAQLAKPFADLSNSALMLRDSVVAVARAQLGKKYKTGGESPERGFDCSGLVKYVLSALHLDAPRTSTELAKVGSDVAGDTTQLRPGDLLMFGKPQAGVSHVGIYIGHGRFIHASSVAGRVVESPLDRRPTALIKAFQSARRFLVSADTVTTLAIAGSGKDRR